MVKGLAPSDSLTIHGKTSGDHLPNDISVVIHVPMDISDEKSRDRRWTRRSLSYHPEYDRSCVPISFNIHACWVETVTMISARLRMASSLYYLFIATDCSITCIVNNLLIADLVPGNG